MVFSWVRGLVGLVGLVDVVTISDPLISSSMVGRSGSVVGRSGSVVGSVVMQNCSTRPKVVGSMWVDRVASAFWIAMSVMEVPMMGW